MVKRYWPGKETDLKPAEEQDKGVFVLHSDYLLLQAALKEALDEWRIWFDAAHLGEEALPERIYELRKLLDN